MIERIAGLPEQVLGFHARGEVTAEDYQTVLVPALEEMLGRQKKVRLLYVLDDAFEGYTGGAAWEDAKVGLKHFTAFDRVAVVTDDGSIAAMVRAFGFALPCEVRVFGNDRAADAHAWISEPLDTSELRFDLREDEGILVVHPRGELVAGDFERLAAQVDPYIEAHGALRGIVIVTEHFPGWDDVAAFTSHLRFVKDHQKKVRRVAIVTDGRVIGFLPRLGTHFLSAELKAFPMSEEEAARAWVSEA